MFEILKRARRSRKGKAIRKNSQQKRKCCTTASVTTTQSNTPPPPPPRQRRTLSTRDVDCESRLSSLSSSSAGSIRTASSIFFATRLIGDGKFQHIPYNAEPHFTLERSNSDDVTGTGADTGMGTARGAYDTENDFPLTNSAPLKESKRMSLTYEDFTFQRSTSGAIITPPLHKSIVPTSVDTSQSLPNLQLQQHNSNNTYARLDFSPTNTDRSSIRRNRIQSFRTDDENEVERASTVSSVSQHRAIARRSRVSQFKSETKSDSSWVRVSGSVSSSISRLSSTSSPSLSKFKPKFGLSVSSIPGFCSIQSDFHNIPENNVPIYETISEISSDDIFFSNAQRMGSMTSTITLPPTPLTPSPPTFFHDDEGADSIDDYDVFTSGILQDLQAHPALPQKRPTGSEANGSFARQRNSSFVAVAVFSVEDKASATTTTKISTNVDDISIVQLTRQEAEALVLKHAPHVGTFMFRESGGIVVLTAWDGGKFHHLKVQNDGTDLPPSKFGGPELRRFICYYQQQKLFPLSLLFTVGKEVTK